LELSLDAGIGTSQATRAFNPRVLGHDLRAGSSKMECAKMAVLSRATGGTTGRIDMALKDKFKEAQDRVQKLSQRPSNPQLLELYGLFKQATEGDVAGSRPGLLDLKGRAKFDAWASRKGLSKDQAMKKYVAAADTLAEELG
jgi:diazepam-binding inhibitor (GABA receptor modulating acyl-CoA-binding protein)